MVRNHDMHMAAALERARVTQLAKHEQKIRENERRRIAATLVSTSCKPSDDFEGCVE